MMWKTWFKVLRRRKGKPNDLNILSQRKSTQNDESVALLDFILKRIRRSIDRMPQNVRNTELILIRSISIKCASKAAAGAWPSFWVLPAGP